jgi:hypothetical protein
VPGSCGEASAEAPGRTGSSAGAAEFERFVAIDWSGANGRRHKGIAVAVAGPGESAPEIVRPDGSPRAWSRTGVLEWLLEQAEAGPRALVGFDFSFAPPFVARGSYLPGDPVPDTGPAFWAYVDRLCHDEDLGAVSLLAHHHRRHFYFGAADGRKADFLHLRTCELAFNAGGGGKPSTVYDAIGAAQVAKASFAGMRLLNRLRGPYAVWPFDALTPDRGAVVEIYARAFIRRAGLPGRKLRELDTLNMALGRLGSRPVASGRPLSDHETDAIVSAAGLRAVAHEARCWSPAGLTPTVAVTEGWTFGVL